MTKRRIFIILLALTLFTSSLLNAAPVYASASEDTESPETVSDLKADQETDADAESEEPDTGKFDSIAEAAILIEASTGKVLYEKNADEAMPPASITKIMTLLLGFEALERGDIAWDDMVTISERAWSQNVEGSKMFLLVDTQVKLEDIITGISVVSANDGCIALAEHISGSVEAFVQQMNNRAKELGLSNSQFKNPHGLPEDGHYMSARDIAVLSRHLINNHPKILEIESKKDFTFNEIFQQNRNPLLGVYPGADGLKTGWTEEAGYCLVGTAIQDGMRLISVVLKTKDEAERLAASRELLDYGFQNYEVAQVADKGDRVGEIDVKNGKSLTVPVKIDDPVAAVIPKNAKDRIQVELNLKEDVISAPVEAGTVVGKAEYRLGDEMLASVDISTMEEVEKAGFFEIIWREIVNFFRSLFSVSTEN
ncbi:MAG: D-alanyl-D-alanine carboxypeptidase [Clostridiales bacterium]|jgi:D-alanyl-D-alanine carboxypeptidase (penicillin-binding protein 5/6)|nr:D-alanyl-D-alanine carboxypeptidase [Clostridiales bacterium]